MFIIDMYLMIVLGIASAVAYFLIRSLIDYAVRAFKQ